VRDDSNKQFNAFCKEVGEGVAQDALERIGDALWNKDKQNYYKVKFSDIHQHNACNHTMTGVVEVLGKSYGFIIQMGDWNGCSIVEWGDPEEVGTYDPPNPVLRTFVPIDDSLETRKPAEYMNYLRQTKTDWFKEKERNYNYDLHFQPGSKTESYYNDWAKTKGMKTAYKESQPNG